MEIYLEKLKHPKWQKKRLRILERDKFACRFCHNTKITLHVHHLIYLNNREPWEYDDNILITVCEKCHNNIFKEINIKDLLIEHLFILGLDKSLRWFMKDFIDNLFDMINSGHCSIIDFYREWLEWKNKK